MLWTMRKSNNAKFHLMRNPLRDRKTLEGLVQHLLQEDKVTKDNIRFLKEELARLGKRLEAKEKMVR